MQRPGIKEIKLNCLYRLFFDLYNFTGQQEKKVNRNFGLECSHSKEDSLYPGVADQLVKESSWDISDLWQYCWVPVLENYEGFDFEKVGDKAEVIGYTMEVTGRKTFKKLPTTPGKKS